MMKKKLKKYVLQPLYNGVSRLPLAGGWIRRWKVNRNYAVERQVLKGKHRSSCPHKSVLFFTVYKAASSFIGGFMGKIVGEAGLTPVDLDGYFFEIGRGRQWEASGRLLEQVSYQPFGYFYGPFRSFNRVIVNLDDFKILLVLRDPRDAIVSSFYSLYSHVLPQVLEKEEIEMRRQRRKKKTEQTVDEYIINKMNETTRLTDHYYEYHRELMGRKNVLFLKYEDMVADFDPWLDRLVQFLELGTSQRLIDEIKAGASFKVSREDVRQHKRQVKPGEHKRKLKPETVDFLNSRVKEILDLFGYPLEIGSREAAKNTKEHEEEKK
jgi:hypothetical protein